MEYFRLHNAERAIGCPGSLTLTPRVTLEPDPERERKKLEGRTADWCIEKLMRADPVFAGETGPHGLPVTDEMIDGVKLYFDVIRQYTGEEPNYISCAEVEADLNWLTDEYRRVDPNPDDCVKDKFGRLWRGAASGWTMHKHWGIMGRSDYRHLRGTARHLTVIDFKYGHRAVEAVDNPQLIGACLDYDTLRHIDTATLIIVQPRDLRGETVRVWNVDAATINHWRQVFVYAVWQANQPNAPLNTGPWCRTCNAPGLCPALEDLLMQQRTVLDAPQTLTAEEVGERLTRVIGLAETSDTMKTVLKQQALAMIKAGIHVPGVKAVRGASRRSLKRVDELEMIATLYGVDRSALFVEKPRGLGEIEKLLPTETLDLVTDKPQGQLEVVLEGDKRPAAIENNPAAAFGPAQ